jgi:hypothetical protein
MFLFRKKTKSLPINIIHHKRGGFAKKVITPRESHSLQRKDEKRVVREKFYFVYLFLWVVFTGVSGYVLIFSPLLRLNSIQVNGTVDIPKQEIEQFIQMDMAGKYGGVIPKNNLLTVPRGTVEKDVQDHFKKIRSVEVSRVFPSTLVIQIQERKTLVLWCVNEQCFYIDENGYAYAPMDTVQSSDQPGHFLKITDTSGQAINTDEPILDQEFVRAASDIQGRLQQELGIAVDVECTTPSRFSDNLILKTQEGWTMYINVQLPIEKSLQTLQLLFKKEISPERRQHLKYIDLRTENRVYYSVEGETVSAPPETPETTPQPATVAPAEDKTMSKDKKK